MLRSVQKQLLLLPIEDHLSKNQQALEAVPLTPSTHPLLLSGHGSPQCQALLGALPCSQLLRSQRILCIYKIFIRLQRPRIKTKGHKNIHRRLDQKSLQPNVLSVMLAIADAEGRAQGEGQAYNKTTMICSVSLQ